MLYTSRYRSHHDAAQTLKKKFTMEISAEDYLEKSFWKSLKSHWCCICMCPFAIKSVPFVPFTDRINCREDSIINI